MSYAEKYNPDMEYWSDLYNVISNDPVLESKTISQLTEADWKKVNDLIEKDRG